MGQIPQNEILINPASYTDPSGEVFIWQDKIFRGIVKEQSGFFKKLLQNDIIRKLQNQGSLIETSVSSWGAEDFDLVLEHRKIQYLNYCFEWAPQMLKDAALLMLNICLEILDDDLILQDAYPWNIFFEGTKPIFIDFGSFVPARRDVLWAPYEQFCNFFLYPLYLYSVGLYDVGRRPLFDYLSGLQAKQFFRLAPFSLKARYPLQYTKHVSNYFLANIIQKLKLEKGMCTLIDRSYRRFNVSHGRKRILTSLVKEVESIRMPNERSHWCKYYGSDMCSYNKDGFEKKEKMVHDIINTYKPSSILDVGCNTGFYSSLAVSRGVKVVAIDTDEPSVSQLYKGAKQNNTNILPLVMDVLNPTPSFGWCSKQFPSAIERIKVDMVFALALIHHLTIVNRQGFARVLETFDCFTNRYVVLEFISKDDPKAHLLIERSFFSYPWYTLDNLKKELYKRYNNIEFFPPHAPGRQLILYEKRKS